MKTIPTKNGELLCVEVPMEAYDINVGLFNVYYEIRTTQGMKVTVPMDIGGGRDKFSIIGTITNGLFDVDGDTYFPWPYHEFLEMLTSQKIEYAGKKLVILQTK